MSKTTAKIKFVIDKDGNIFSEVNGIKGPQCAKVDKFLESLGEVKFSKTGEFFENGQPSDVYIVGGNQQ